MNVCVLEEDWRCPSGAQPGIGTSAVTRRILPYHSASYLPLLQHPRSHKTQTTQKIQGHSNVSNKVLSPWLSLTFMSAAASIKFYISSSFFSLAFQPSRGSRRRDCKSERWQQSADVMTHWRFPRLRLKSRLFVQYSMKGRGGSGGCVRRPGAMLGRAGDLFPTRKTAKNPPSHPLAPLSIAAASEGTTTTFGPVVTRGYCRQIAIFWRKKTYPTIWLKLLWWKRFWRRYS